jgi:hypothetical protein
MPLSSKWAHSSSRPGMACTYSTMTIESHVSRLSDKVQRARVTCQRSYQ